MIRPVVAALLLLTFFVSCRPDDPTPPPPAATQPDAARTPEPAREPPEVAEARAPEDVVKELGRRMKDVPTTATPDIAGPAMREAYGGLVEPSLLDRWAATPANAPGRAVSSPWPDRIEVTSSSTTGDETIVRGVVVERTSTGEARRVPVEIHVRRANGAWLITSYKEVAEASDAVDAVAVIRDYYAAIAARDYERAFRLWGSAGPPGQAFDEFKAGFADTIAVDVKTDEPSRVEGAAGSHYVSVPVVVTAKTRNGGTETFEGTYTLRRSVVDGASASDRRWHLHRATIRRISRAIA